MCQYIYGTHLMGRYMSISFVNTSYNAVYIKHHKTGMNPSRGSWIGHPNRFFPADWRNLPSSRGAPSWNTEAPTAFLASTMSHLRRGGGPAASLIQIWENLGWIVQYNLVLNLCFFPTNGWCYNYILHRRHTIQHKPLNPKSSPVGIAHCWNFMETFSFNF